MDGGAREFHVIVSSVRVEGNPARRFLSAVDHVLRENRLLNLVVVDVAEHVGTAKPRHWKR